MDNAKSLFASKTFWGAVIALAGGVGAIFGHTIPATDQASLVDDLSGIATAIGSVVAIYGRMVASTQVTILPKSGG